jgi:N6-L-threonylcarbamoyladenine synthase
MLILAIDTSCDETSVAVTDGRRILANEIYSQILIHKKWGGVVPSLAKRAHEERIDWVIEEAFKKLKIKNLKLKINHIAVTYGPGLAVALEVGIAKAKELAKKYNKKIIAVNHMEGHIYSCFAQNRNGNPKGEFSFPYLVLLVSGGHTELVIFKNHLDYQIIGETIDDAGGEALDKAAKMLGLGYPGGPVIERLAKIGNPNYHKFPRPLIRSKDLNFSFSGLKTSFFYFIKNLKEEQRIKNLNNLVSSYQEAVFDSLLYKLKLAIKETGIKNILAAGGVLANLYLRKRIRQLVKKYQGQVLFPLFKNLYGDNAAMIGIAAYYKAEKGIFVKDWKKLDRVPRLSL